ncbi:MAG: putative zinc-binding metallopeptidase [Deltaproteobacteria bacterium]|nr:putative zinc-binding metallopeptidase [Deltaproteobacteria bacterium]
MISEIASKHWSELSDEELLTWRICDLRLTIAGTDLEKAVATLHRELSAKGIVFHPPCYLGDEWFCPDGVPVIAIPFFLAHPRLKQLEKKMILEVEGAIEEDCLRLLRHEAGHSINYAYALHRRKKWRELFGNFSDDYPETYRPHPYSKRFVRHLDNWYAQYHPDEDFAETFAVWLQPNFPWREYYQGWKALEKLEYVDQLMKEIAGKPAKVEGGKRICEADKLRTTLDTYYRRKRKLYGPDLPGFYDRDLQRIFPKLPEQVKSEAASKFIRRHRQEILTSVSRWTGEPKLMISRLLTSLIERCRELDLRASESQLALQVDIAAYLTMLTMNYRQHGKFVRIP